MKPADVAASYDGIAEVWDAPGFPRDNGIAAHERALAFLGRAGAALDVGCGASGRFIELLLGRGFEVEGLDLSARMLELARRRHPQVRFHLADVCEWQPPRAYDFVTAWDSIWHVPLAEHARVLEKLLGALAPGGVCIFTFGGTDEPGEKRDSAMGPPMYYSTLGVPGTLHAIERSGCILRHLEYDQHPELHVCTIVQRT